MENRIEINIKDIIKIPKAPLHRTVFSADKKKFYNISKRTVHIPLLFGLCIDGLEKWNPTGFKLELSNEDEERFLHEVYEPDIKRLDEICKREGFKQIPFRFLFREIVNSLETE